jgi:protein associated with RNAse G/E
MTVSPKITVRVLKYDGTEYRRWPATVARRSDPLLVLDAEFADAVTHPLLGNINRGTRTIEYYWLDRWYNVFQFLEADGSTKLFYCNINMPPEINGGVLSYVDLDLDVLVQPDFSYQVLDRDEFAANAERYSYTEQVRTQTDKAVNELLAMIAARQFPFLAKA